ncbi:GNAT family N-acetyltransferase [Terribacillus sp. 179-K 1B1 HS]|uniref:GNAT family N-acetyltransferase n=1 Tax=Terribacillus sp. 179-K 1B1 HS TaxID=3142388 RepID=UPI0039A0D0CB
MNAVIKQIPKEMTWEIRHLVLWPDKEFDYVVLENDDAGKHYGLFIDDKLVSVISLFIKKNEAQFRKFATLQEEQGKGYGSLLLKYTLNQCQRLGVNRVWCNARQDKVPFYKKFGLQETSLFLVKGGLKFPIMEKTNN